MAVKFLLLLYASFIIVIITKPTVAFLNGNQLCPSFYQVTKQNKLKFPVPFGVKGDAENFSERVKLAIVTAVSFQFIFTPGQANAMSPSSNMNIQVQSPLSKDQILDVSENADIILNNPLLLSLSIPQGSGGILTTTIRSEAFVNEALTDISFRKLDWLKNVSPVNVDAMFESFPKDISHISEKIESLSASWILFFSMVGTVLIADASQHSKKLDQLTDEQATVIAEQTSEMESIGVVNANTVEVLKADSVRLTEEMEKLMKQVEEKSAHIDTLSETVNILTQSIGSTDTNAKQVLAQLAEQLVLSKVQLSTKQSTIETLEAKVLVASQGITSNIEMEYKRQFSDSEKTIAALSQKMINIQEDLAVVSKNKDELFSQNKQLSDDLLMAKDGFKERSLELENFMTFFKASEGALVNAMNTMENMDNRMKEMLISIETLTDENTQLASKLLAAEVASIAQLDEQKKIMTEQLDKAAEALAMLPTAGDAQKLLSQVTAENDDLKQRLLSSDESLFELQQESEVKLDSAKAMAKELIARLTEKSVQQETNDGKLLLQLRELEEAKDVAQRLLLEAQTTLALMIAKSDNKDTIIKKVKAVKKNSTNRTSSLNGAGDLITSYREMTASKLKKMTNKELEEMLVAIGVTPKNQTKAQLIEILQSKIQ